MRFRRRLLYLYILFCVGIGLVWLRSAQMILVDGEEWIERARERRQSTERLDAMRGPIVSADGVTLAEDVCQFQLAVVGWEWERRDRARCTACGLMHFPGASGRLPRRCACPDRLLRGGGSKRSDAYPREGAAHGDTTLVKIPSGDLRTLEDALELKHGTLGRLANKRVEEIKRIVADYKQTLLDRREDSDFLIDDKVRLRRSDLMLRPFVIVDAVPQEAVRLVQTDESGRYRGFRIHTALRRRYPLGDFAPQLLGFTSVINSREEYERLYARFGSQITHSTRLGRAGLERAYNTYLHGKTGRRRMQLEGGSFSKIVDYDPPVPGAPLRLSLSASVTVDAQRILDAAATPQGYLPGGRPSAAFVALDADTGEILIWAEAPRFDLNDGLKDLYDPKRTQARIDPDARIWVPRHPLEGTMTMEEWRAQIVMPVPRSLSRVAQVAVEPGSTFKPLIALGLLGGARPISQEGMLCRHGMGMPGCHNCGTVYLEQALSRSCNRYFAWSLRNPAAWKTNRYFVAQFLEDIGIGEHPGEVKEWSRGQWLWDWYDFSLDEAVAYAQARLKTQMGAKAPTVHLGRHPRVPATIGGDPKRLGRTIAAVARHVATRSGTRSVSLYVTRHATEGREVILRFGVRSNRKRAWHLAPDFRKGKAALPRVLRPWHPRNAGISGKASDRGTIWFNIRFERRMGRAAGERPVIRPDDGYNVGIGQGPVLTTPLQMARAIAVIANGGTVVTPHVAVQGARPLAKADRARVTIAPQHLRRVRDGMFDAVESGTARKADWHEVPATIYGKTGTAQVGGTWKPWSYEDDEEAPWHHWFVGYAEAPGRRTIAFACVLHSRTEQAAGLTAVPAVQRILTRWYLERD